MFTPVVSLTKVKCCFAVEFSRRQEMFPRSLERPILLLQCLTLILTSSCFSASSGETSQLSETTVLFTDRGHRIVSDFITDQTINKSLLLTSETNVAWSGKQDVDGQNNLAIKLQNFKNREGVKFDENKKRTAKKTGLLGNKNSLEAVLLTDNKHNYNAKTKKSLDNEGKIREFVTVEGAGVRISTTVGYENTEGSDKNMEADGVNNLYQINPEVDRKNATFTATGASVGEGRSIRGQQKTKVKDNRNIAGNADNMRIDEVDIKNNGNQSIVVARRVKSEDDDAGEDSGRNKFTESLVKVGQGSLGVGEENQRNESQQIKKGNNAASEEVRQTETAKLGEEVEKDRDRKNKHRNEQGNAEKEDKVAEERGINESTELSRNVEVGSDKETRKGLADDMRQNNKDTYRLEGEKRNSLPELGSQEGKEADENKKWKNIKEAETNSKEGRTNAVKKINGSEKLVIRGQHQIEKTNAEDTGKERTENNGSKGKVFNENEGKVVDDDSDGEEGVAEDFESTKSKENVNQEIDASKDKVTRDGNILEDRKEKKDPFQSPHLESSRKQDDGALKERKDSLEVRLPGFFVSRLPSSIFYVIVLGGSLIFLCLLFRNRRKCNFMFTRFSHSFGTRRISGSTYQKLSTTIDENVLYEKSHLSKSYIY